MNRPSLAGTTLSFSSHPAHRTAPANKKGLDCFSYNDRQQQQQQQQQQQINRDLYISRTALENNGYIDKAMKTTTTLIHPDPTKPGSGTLHSSDGGVRAWSGQASGRVQPPSQSGKRLLGKTRSEASSLVSRDPAWRHNKLHDSRILTELTFLKISDGHDFLDPNFHRSLNTKPIRSTTTSSSRKPLSLPKGTVHVSSTMLSSTGKFGGLVVNTDPNHALIMNASRCNIRQRNGSAPSGANGRNQTWSHNISYDTLPVAIRPSFFRHDSGGFYNNTFVQQQNEDVSKFPGFRRGNTLPAIPTYSRENHNDTPSSVFNYNTNILTKPQPEYSIKRDISIIKGIMKEGDENKLVNNSSTVKDKSTFAPERITNANLSLSEFVCIKVEESMNSNGDVVVDPTSPSPETPAHLTQDPQSPLASFSSISTAVERCSASKRVVRFSINHKVREYSPWAPVDTSEDEGGTHAEK